MLRSMIVFSLVAPMLAMFGSLITPVRNYGHCSQRSLERASLRVEHRGLMPLRDTRLVLRDLGRCL